MGAKQRIKHELNRLLERILHHRLEHVARLPRDPAISLRRLAAAGFQPRQAADIGAAQGHWTRDLTAVFPSTQFWLADPLEENRQALSCLAAENKRVKVWLGAVGDHCGTLALHVHADQTSSFVSEWGGEGREVRLATLDSLIEGNELAPPDLIKLDVQGAELMVMTGAHRAFAAATVVQVEVSFRHVYEGAPLAPDIVAQMADMKFRIYDICDLYKRPVDGALLQADLIFARQGPWFDPERWNVRRES